MTSRGHRSLAGRKRPSLVRLQVEDKDDRGGKRVAIGRKETQGEPQTETESARKREREMRETTAYFELKL